MTDQTNKSTNSFVAQAAILSVSGFIVKLIGMLFKIPIANLLGSSMSIFSAAYSVYTMLFVISNSGLPIAVSRMVAAAAGKGRPLEIKKIFRMANWMFGSVGFVCALLMYFGAEWFVAVTGHAGAATAMKVIAPSLFFICITSAYRGYFQGLRNMYPTALSQLIEAFIKMAVGVFAAYIAVKQGKPPEVQVAYAVSGLTLGIFLSMLFLVLAKKLISKVNIRRLTDYSLRYRQIGIKILMIALPVTLTSTALYLSSFWDTLILVNTLKANGFAESATSLYGAYTALSITLSDILPSTFVFPIAVSILPALTSALVKKNRKQSVGYMVSSLKISTILAFPSAICLAVLARPAIAFIYGSSWGSAIELGEKTVMPIDIAAPALTVLALGSFFIAMMSTINALHQATGRLLFPLISVGAGIAFLLAFEIPLVKWIGIYGAPISSLICYAIAFTLNLHFLRRSQGLKLRFVNMFLKPLICALFAGGYCFIANRAVLSFFPNPGGRFANMAALIVCVIGAVPLYAFLLLLTKGITAAEVRLLPFGDKLCNYFIRKGMLKDDRKRAKYDRLA